MKTKREWQDNPDLFELIADALERGVDAAGVSDVVKVVARDEISTHGDRGTISVRVGETTFLLELHELT